MSLIPYFPNLKEYIPEGIRINQITAGHAKEFHEKLKTRGMATTTIHKRIQFAGQFMHDAVDWKIIDENPFSKVRTPSETLSLRWEDIDWEMNRMSIPEPKVEHHQGRGVRSCPIFPELRPTVTRASEPAAGSCSR